MTSNKDEEQSRRIAQEYIAARNLLVKGMELLGAFANSDALSHNSVAEQHVKRAYILVKQKFLSICEKYPDFDSWKENIFRGIPRLGGSYDADYIADWLAGDFEFDENGQPIDFRRFGGSHAYDDEIEMIAEEIYTLAPDLKDIDTMPDNSPYKKVYDEAEDALKDAKAAQRLEDIGGIKEYTLDWDTKTGKVMVNGAFKVAKTELGSTSSTNAIMKQLTEARKGKKVVEFEPKLRHGEKRSVSHLLNVDLHINPTLKAIFFKGTEGKTIKFRSPVDRKTIEAEGIDGLDKLDLDIMRAKIDAGK